VRFRAAAMQEAVPVGTGAMAAILGMGAAAVIAGCAEAQATFGAGSAEVVEAVNFNDPAQTVIAGSKAAVEKACEMLKAAGAKRALSLPVSAPFHSSLMKPAAEKLQAKLAETTFAAPRIPVINNIDVVVNTDMALIKDALVRQAYGPVRWVECVAAIKARGISTVVECGPGKVLAGMVKRIDGEMTGAAMYDLASLAEVKTLLA
jgi:[acyl-carrier-protein] S-malonyltransferase